MIGRPCRRKQLSNFSCALVYNLKAIKNLSLKFTVCWISNTYRYTLTLNLDLDFICWTPPLLQNPGSASVGLSNVER